MRSGMRSGKSCRSCGRCRGTCLHPKIQQQLLPGTRSRLLCSRKGVGRKGSIGQQGLEARLPASESDDSRPRFSSRPSQLRHGSSHRRTRGDCTDLSRQLEVTWCGGGFRPGALRLEVPNVEQPGLGRCQDDGSVRQRYEECGATSGATCVSKFFFGPSWEEVRVGKSLSASGLRHTTCAQS